MKNDADAAQNSGSPVRDWIDPTRIYNTGIPAGRLSFLWGLAIYPVVVIFLLLTLSIIILEAVSPSTDVADYIGIVTWMFMLAWVTATVCICLRRLRALRQPPRRVWWVVLPIANLIFFLYLLLKS
jgi:uncharacterized membrane protein YhaH (DUF805 family)